ncbi:MFS general substrate transporter [Periconia macrospinosa]|uniref:MFS general substrate transporter n=1 Tax=Periconia macrospinosa TaxID=97972 RepID=A0A2V1DVZ9_9PLEO|nr:MFS general substrate transporter [Periconia macrospinosa]
MHTTSVEAGDCRGRVLAGTITAVTVSGLFVCTHIISRRIILRKLCWDDYMVVLAWLLSFGLSLAICYGTSKGIGLHLARIPPEWLPELRKSIYACAVLYNPAWMVTKTSILTFYLRVFRLDRFTVWSSIIILVIVCSSGIVLTFLNLFQCRPISAGWIGAPIDRSNLCINIVVLYLSSAPVNLITDVAILLLPIRIVTRLHLPRRQKAILVFTFALGAFVIAVGVMRIAYLEEAVLAQIRNEDVSKKIEGRELRLPVDKDMPYDVSLSYMWSAVEVNVGIIFACLPSLKLLAARVFPWVLGGSTSTGDGDRRRHSSGVQLSQVIPLRTGNSTTNTAATICTGNDNIEPFPRLSSLPDTHHSDKPIPDPDSIDFSQSTSAGITTTCYNPSGSFVTNRNRESKSLIRLTVKESYRPIAIVTVLFLISGIVYVWITTINGYIQKVSNASLTQTIQLQAFYYAGYLFGPLCITQFILKKFGFQLTMVTGLSIFAVGCMMVWPSAVLLSTPGFSLSNFVIGVGISTIEMSAITFVMLCGPAIYAEIRFLCASVIARTGGVVSCVIANKVLTKGVVDATSLVNTQWAYLSLALLVVLLAVLISYMRLFEVSDAELEHDAAYIIGERQVFTLPCGKTYVCKWDVVNTTFVLGLISAICYQGAQGVIDFFFNQYVKSMAGNSRLSAVDIGLIGRAAVAISRFLALIACIFFEPRLVLLHSYVALAIVSILSLTVEGNTGIIMGVLIRFFGGPIWPLLYVNVLKGMGRSTKSAAAAILATASTAGISPGIAYLLQKHSASVNPTQHSFSIMAAFACIGLVFPIFINFSRAARKQTCRRR